MGSRETFLRKQARLQRSLDRARDKYRAAASTIEEDLDAQDIVLVNLQRACEQAIDIAQILVRQLGVPRPTSNKELFTELSRAGHLDPGLARRLAAMVGFRNLLVHEYDVIDLAIVRAVVERELDVSDMLSATALRLLEDSGLTDDDGAAAG